jgi:hypothetical protein
MSDSFSYTENSSFTVTNARQLAAKVATDLKRLQRFYGKPSDANIADYQTEATEMIRAGYLQTVTYGFKRDGKWIEPTLRYAARDLASASQVDDDPGKIRPGADVSGASFGSYMTYTAAWDRLSQIERETFEASLPFARNGAPEPGVSGYLSNDRTYSSGGRSLDRSTVRSF